MKIRDVIHDGELKTWQRRLAMLIQTEESADDVVSIVTKEIEAIKYHKYKIGGDQALLDLEVYSWELRQNSKGQWYVQFDNGVRYYPKAKYGRFIVRRA